MLPSRRVSTQVLFEGVRRADRALLARAITLIESRHPVDVSQAQELLEALLPYTGGAIRVGVTGVPGVGKSTFLDAFGMRLLESGHRVAVLAVDPSSARSGGSILGDKTRMFRLAASPGAFIRPSPSGLSLGGVSRRTREAMLVCEAAGFDVVLIETVGVGQSETVVAELVDCFLALMLPGAGDELQGIKKGLLELTDIVAVNKSDGAQQALAGVARSEYAAALRYQTPRSSWKPQALQISALTGEGLEALWGLIRSHREVLQASGELGARRSAQQKRWLWSLLEEGLRQSFETHSEVRRLLPELEAAVEGGRVPVARAAQQLLGVFLGRDDGRAPLDIAAAGADDVL